MIYHHRSSHHPLHKRPHVRTRKSTITQQEKNKKRQRATPNQLVVLNQEYLKNPTPNARAREDIGERIDMTERSVQIWFQNKRAKAKQANNKKLYRHPDYDDDYESPNVLPTNSKTENSWYNCQDGAYYSSNMMSPISNGVQSIQGMTLDNYSTPSIKPLTYDNPESIPRLIPTSMDTTSLSNLFGAPSIVFSCTSLAIGTWTRVLSVGATISDLSVVYIPTESKMTYSMYDNGIGYRVEIPFKIVQQITMNCDNDPTLGQIKLRVNKVPTFWIRLPSNAWSLSEDFSEARQASKLYEHTLSGPYTQLQAELSHLYSFQPTKFPDGAFPEGQSQSKGLCDIFDIETNSATWPSSEMEECQQNTNDSIVGPEEKEEWTSDQNTQLTEEMARMASEYGSLGLEKGSANIIINPGSFLDAFPMPENNGKPFPIKEFDNDLLSPAGTGTSISNHIHTLSTSSTSETSGSLFSGTSFDSISPFSQLPQIVFDNEGNLSLGPHYTPGFEYMAYNSNNNLLQSSGSDDDKTVDTNNNNENTEDKSIDLLFIEPVSGQFPKEHRN